MRSSILIAVVALSGLVACVADKGDGAPPAGPPEATSRLVADGPARALVPPVVMQPRDLSGELVDEALAPDRLRELTAPTAWGARVMPYDPKALDADQRAAALRERSGRRAYEGAPPPMRHSTQFVKGSFDCLDCHREGMWLGKRLARPMSHVELPNCLQCHVEADNEAFAQDTVLPVNGFEGLGTRVPPEVPHEIGLRENCSACHESLSVVHQPDASPGKHAWWPAMPPAMPHGQGDEARRDCRGCHVVAVDEAVAVGHPIGRARFSDCISCHRGDAHEDFGAPRIAPGVIGELELPLAADVEARADCLGCHVFATPTGEVGLEVGSLPPRIPHTTLLRTRCISCHGEYGYAGLTIDHADRGQCLQCHLPKDGVDRGLDLRPPTTFH